MSVIELPLSRGLMALIDAEDYEAVGRVKWTAHSSSKGTLPLYVLRHCPGNHGLALRLHNVLMSPPPGFEVDHIDRDGLNNRRSNLRVVDHSSNQRNRKLPSNNTSGYRGVTFSNTRRGWSAKARVQKVTRYFGHFPTREEAAAAYDLNMFLLVGGDFCRNFPLI